MNWRRPAPGPDKTHHTRYGVVDIVDIVLDPLIHQLHWHPRPQGQSQKTYTPPKDLVIWMWLVLAGPVQDPWRQEQFVFNTGTCGVLRINVSSATRSVNQHDICRHQYSADLFTDSQTICQAFSYQYLYVQTWPQRTHVWLCIVSLIRTTPGPVSISRPHFQLWWLHFVKIRPSLILLIVIMGIPIFYIYIYIYIYIHIY